MDDSHYLVARLRRLQREIGLMRIDAPLAIEPSLTRAVESLRDAMTILLVTTPAEADRSKAPPVRTSDRAVTRDADRLTARSGPG